MLNRIYTIGHSTRTLEELIELLREHSVTRLADVRRYPGSRRHPQFSRESLETSLAEAGLAYLHFEDLGGRRSTVLGSPNGGLHNPQFQGYADHMGTPLFLAAVDRLIDAADATAVMCAEAVPWRCHRNLLADELVRRGIEVIHIVSPGSSRPHSLHQAARIAGDRVTYPPAQATMFQDRRV